MSKRKGQFSFEFLTTYGWMLMITLIVGGALAYYGVFSSDKTLPQECNFGFDFGCKKYTAFTNGTVRAALQNGVGTPVKVINFVCEYPDGTNESMNNIPTNDWMQGEEMTLSCDPTTAKSFNAGDRLQIKATLYYKKVTGGFIKTAPGVIKVNAVQS